MHLVLNRITAVMIVVAKVLGFVMILAAEVEPAVAILVPTWVAFQAVSEVVVVIEVEVEVLVAAAFQVVFAVAYTVEDVVVAVGS
jgi:hypothetical protein